MQSTITMMIGMSFGVIAKTQCASWLFVYNYWHTHKSDRHNLCLFYSLFEVKQTQITLNLFHFSLRRVHFIQEERNGAMRSNVVELIILLILYLLLPYSHVNI